MLAALESNFDRNTENGMAHSFEAMLPSIQKVGRYAFRHLPQWRQDELLADIVARSYEAFVGLVKRGKAELAYPTVLARYAIKQVCQGRQTGVKQNVNDVLSPLAQRQRGFRVQPLQRPDARGQWQDVLVEDRHAGPAEVAAVRLDFRNWLAGLKRFQRQVALHLAVGETTSDTARRFSVSNARISQLRKELQANWNAFQTAPVGCL